MLLLTPAQINRLDNAEVEGRRAQICLSARQVATNVSYIGFFLGMLASLADRALPPILSELTTGLRFGGINKAVRGTDVGVGLISAMMLVCSWERIVRLRIVRLRIFPFSDGYCNYLAEMYIKIKYSVFLLSVFLLSVFLL